MDTSYEVINYIKKLACKAAKMIVPVPEDIVIPEKNLKGLDNVEFISAFIQY